MITPQWGTVSLLEIVALVAALAGLWASVAGLRAALRARCLLRASGRNGSLLAVSNASVDGERLRILGQALMLANVAVALALPSTYGWQSDLVNLSRAGVSVCLLLLSLRARRLRRDVMDAHEEAH